MMSAAAMGAVAFQKGLGAIHALSHPVGAVYNTHHGMTNAVVMPPVLDEPARNRGADRQGCSLHGHLRRF
jgi:alcohol dehydrogenase class IV